jgi:predicted  nucleic acid-binding Zn-ribbon protein
MPRLLPERRTRYDARSRLWKMRASTDVMSRVSDLWQLQEVDLALDARRSELSNAQSRIGDSEELASAREQLTEHERALRSAQSSQRDLDLQADDLRAKIATAEQKLYGGSVRNPKELQDLQADVDALKRQLSSLEDQDIAAISLLEESERSAEQSRTSVETLDGAWREEQLQLNAAVDRLTAEIAELEEQRKAKAAAADGELLKTYDHVRRVRGGRGVAKVDRNICLGCRIALPPVIVSRARSATGVAQCPNCERILFT